MKTLNKKATKMFLRVKNALNNKGEGYIDSAVKIIIAVVLGSILLALLIFLWGPSDGTSGIGKSIKDAIESMFSKQVS